MPNPMALVASPYDKWFMKSHNFRRHIAANGVQIHEMEWDICSSPPWVTIYPYTMFQNQYLALPITNAEKPLIIQKVLVTQSCNIVHCNWHTQKPYMCRFASLCEHFFLVKIDVFLSVCCQGEFRKQPKFHILLTLTGDNALKFLEWCICMPNPILQVLSLRIMVPKKLQIRQKFHILLILMHCLSGAYLRLEVQYCRFSVISGS